MFNIILNLESMLKAIAVEIIAVALISLLNINV